MPKHETAAIIVLAFVVVCLSIVDIILRHEIVAMREDMQTMACRTSVQE